MGSQFSIPNDIRYVYTNNGVSVPYVRLVNGQWVPLQQQWFIPPYGSQRHFPMMPVGNVYPDYYYPSPTVYYKGAFH